MESSASESVTLKVSVRLLDGEDDVGEERCGGDLDLECDSFLLRFEVFPGFASFVVTFDDLSFTTYGSWCCPLVSFGILISMNEAED